MLDLSWIKVLEIIDGPDRYHMLANDGINCCKLSSIRKLLQTIKWVQSLGQKTTPLIEPLNLRKLGEVSQPTMPEKWVNHWVELVAS